MTMGKKELVPIQVVEVVAQYAGQVGERALEPPRVHDGLSLVLEVAKSLRNRQKNDKDELTTDKTRQESKTE